VSGITLTKSAVALQIHGLDKRPHVESLVETIFKKSEDNASVINHVLQANSVIAAMKRLGVTSHVAMAYAKIFDEHESALAARVRFASGFASLVQADEKSILKLTDDCMLSAANLGILRVARIATLVSAALQSGISPDTVMHVVKSNPAHVNLHQFAASCVSGCPNPKAVEREIILRAVKTIYDL
jgi:hypothetical protein